MRALAEFVMRGRAQAALVALLCTFVPLISSAVVALVTLRRGPLDGSYIAIWAFLPPLVLTVVNPELLPFTFMDLCVMAALMGGAMVLRAGTVWSLALYGLGAIGVTGALVFAGTFPGFLAELVEALNQAQKEAIEASQRTDVDAVTFSATLMAGFVAIGIVLNALLALLIGRWWQALLYNPGGFRDEFHQLRLSKTQALVSFGLMALCLSQPNLGSWGIVAALPLLLVTTAIVHCGVFNRRMGIQWLILYYLLAFWPPMMWFTLLVGFVDAWLNIRGRFGPPPGPPAT